MVLNFKGLRICDGRILKYVQCTLFGIRPLFPPEVFAHNALRADDYVLKGKIHNIV